METRLEANQDLGPAPSTLLPLEEAHHRGRYGTDGDSCAAPRPDPRARPGVPAAVARARRNGAWQVDVKCDVLGPERCD